MTPAEPYPIREFERVVCYRVKVLSGDGSHEQPWRHVIYWYAEDGTLITRQDLYDMMGLQTS